MTITHTSYPHRASFIRRAYVDLMPSTVGLLLRHAAPLFLPLERSLWAKWRDQTPTPFVRWDLALQAIDNTWCETVLEKSIEQEMAYLNAGEGRTRYEMRTTFLKNAHDSLLLRIKRQEIHSDILECAEHTFSALLTAREQATAHTLVCLQLKSLLENKCPVGFHPSIMFDNPIVNKKANFIENEKDVSLPLKAEMASVFRHTSQVIDFVRRENFCNTVLMAVALMERQGCDFSVVWDDMYELLRVYTARFSPTYIFQFGGPITLDPKQFDLTRIRNQIDVYKEPFEVSNLGNRYNKIAFVLDPEAGVTAIQGHNLFTTFVCIHLAILMDGMRRSRNGFKKRISTPNAL